MRRSTSLLAVVTLGFLALAGCGDDAQENATTATTTTVAPASGDATQAFCRRNAELDQLGAPPSAEQLQDLARLAPPAIEADVDRVAERVAEEGMAAYDEQAVRDAIDKIDGWRQENCGGVG